MNDLVKTNQAPIIEFNNEQIHLIKTQVCKGATNDQLNLFLYHAKSTGLNPLARQIFGIIRAGQLSIQTSIDGFRLIAERSGKYAGQIGPLWADEQGNWSDVWLGSKPPFAAKVGVIRKDFKEPLFAVARFDEYANQTNPIWKKLPTTMLAKCAESAALRKAFPQELSGLYTADEMSQADPIAPAHETHQVIEPKITPIINEAPKPEGEYVVPFGKFKGVAIKKINSDELLAYCDYITAQFKEKNQAPNPQVAEFLNHAASILGK